MKIPDQNDLKLGTAVVLASLFKPTDLGLKRSWVGVKVRVVACGSRIIPEYSRCHIIPCKNSSPLT